MNNMVRPNTHQRSELNPRFDELDQFHQDLQSPSLYRFYPDPFTDFCGLIGMIVTLVIAICACIWLISVSTCNAIKVLTYANRTLDISLVNFTNISLSLNESFY